MKHGFVMLLIFLFSIDVPYDVKINCAMDSGKISALICEMDTEFAQMFITKKQSIINSAQGEWFFVCTLSLPM